MSQLMEFIANGLSSSPLGPSVMLA